MTMPFIYVMNHQTSPPRVFEMAQTGGALQIGSDLAGSPAAETHSITDNRTNTVINFKGGIYCWHNDTIREKDSDGMGGTSVGNWGVVYTTTQGGSRLSRHSGLYQAHDAGVPVMIGMMSTPSGIRGVKTTDGVSFTESDATGGAPTLFGRAIVFNNALYWVTNLTTVLRYDPQANTVETVSITPAVQGHTGRDFGIANNKLFMAGAERFSFNTSIAFWELKATGFERTHVFSGYRNDGNSHTGCPSLFSSTGTELYVQFSADENQGLARGVGDVSFRVLNPGLPSQSISPNGSLPVIPGGFEPGGINATGTSRFYSFIDNEIHEDRINGSTTWPDIYQFHTDVPESASTYRIMSLTGGTFMTGFGPTHANITGNEATLSVSPNGGGERIDRAVNTIYAELENPVPGSTAGTTDISFRVYGSGGPLTGTVYYSSQQLWVETVATLTGSVTGGSASRSGNTITNITADDGATLYTFTWDNSADEIVDGVPLRMNIELL